MALASPPSICSPFRLKDPETKIPIYLSNFHSKMAFETFTGQCPYGRTQPSLGDDHRRSPRQRSRSRSPSVKREICVEDLRFKTRLPTRHLSLPTLPLNQSRTYAPHPSRTTTLLLLIQLSLLKTFALHLLFVAP